MKPVIVFLVFISPLPSCLAESPVTQFYQSVSGKWSVDWCEHQGRKMKTASKIASITVNPETIVMTEKDGEEKALRYELLQGSRGMAIDLYATYGSMKGRLLPSRIGMEDGVLKIMLPMNSKAFGSRPDALDSTLSPAWIVMHLQRPETDDDPIVNDEDSATDDEEATERPN